MYFYIAVIYNERGSEEKKPAGTGDREEDIFMKAKGIAATVLSALLFGFTPIIASQTYTMGSNPETLTFYRNLFAVPMLFIVLCIQKDEMKLPKHAFKNLVIYGLLGCGVTTLTLYSAYQFVGVGTATTLHFLYPVFVALICFFVYKEHLGRQKVIALIIASVGVLFFIDPNGNVLASLPGIILAAGSGLTYAIYMVGMDKKGLKKLNPYKISFYIACVVSIAMLIYNIPTGHIVFALPPKALLYTFIVSLGTSFLGVVLLQVGIKHLSATTAAIFCLFEPVSSCICSWLLLHEAFPAAKIVGCLVILEAVAVLMTAKSGPDQNVRTKVRTADAKNR